MNYVNDLRKIRIIKKIIKKIIKNSLTKKTKSRENFNRIRRFQIDKN
jgi:hypothetical protein